MLRRQSTIESILEELVIITKIGVKYRSCQFKKLFGILSH